MMQEIVVIAVGAHVSIGFGEKIEGVVTAVCIGGKGKIRYEVSWWNCRSHESGWLEEFEVEPKGDRQVRIGFRSDQ